MWAGEDIKYVGLHKRIKSIKGDPKICEHCGSIDKKKYEWANIDHKYSTSPNDYIRLCTQCHRKYDIEHNNYKSAIVVASTEARITLTNLS